MDKIHIDEKAGSDSTGLGTPDQPYETLAFALFTHQASSPQFLIRKDPAGAYEEPTQSALKKARKGADGLEKKKKKAEEAAAKEAQATSEERERREKLLEDSKKIVLKEDETLSKATRVCASCFQVSHEYHGVVDSSSVDLQAKLGSLTELRTKRIRVFGWVHRFRPQKDIIFLVLRDGTGYLQAVLSGQVVRCSLFVQPKNLIHITP